MKMGAMFVSRLAFVPLFQTFGQIPPPRLDYGGLTQEVFFLNLEDGYFGCQVNESSEVLQLFELSKLCDGVPQCYLGSDELVKELKCTSEY